MMVSDSTGFHFQAIRPSILHRQSELCVEFLREASTVCEAGQAVDRALSAALRKRRELGARDRRLIQQVVFSVFRWRGWIHSWLPCQPMSAMLLASLFDQVPWNALCDYWASEGQHPVLEQGFVLSSSLSEKQAWLREYTGQAVALKDLVPAWFLDASKEMRDAEGAWLESCLQSLQTLPPLWLRLQTAVPETVLKELSQRQIPTILAPLFQALGLTEKIDVHTLKTFHQGAFEIQDLASQCVGWICNPQSGERWWDVCAGGGGKSLHLAALMKNQGKVCSTEIRPSMVAEIRSRARRGRWTCIKARGWNGELPPEGFTPTFDGVLVDVPCSGTGTWRRNPDLRWRTFPTMIESHVQEQKRILAKAQEYVRPGGKLVYATCSVLASENTEVVQDFLKCHPHFQWERFAHPVTREQVEGQLTILPHEFNSNGMFIALLRRHPTA